MIITIALNMLFTTTTTTLALAALLTHTSAFPIDPTNYYYPATNSIYHVETGQVEYDSLAPGISRIAGRNDETVLVAFSFLDKSVGKTCQFMFELDGPDPYTGAGTTFDVFTSSKPIMNSIPVGSSNYRNQYVGRMTSVGGGQAVPFYDEETMERFQFPCPAPTGTGEQVGFEVVPVGESAGMSWSKRDGPWVAIVD